MTDTATAGTDEKEAAPRADLHDALGWMAFGTAVLVGSITMDRLERQNINPVTAPGLLPGLLGIAMIVLGAVMGLRSWRRGALAHPVPARTPHERVEFKRALIAIALCVGYGVVLVGHGLPFWLASSIYVTVSILVFQRLSPDAEQRRLTPRSWAKALTIAITTSVITWLVFERVFLVRMP